MSNNNKLIEIRNVSTHFMTAAGEVKAVDGISFSLSAGKTMALVGESGCGKSVTGLSIMRLIPEPPGKIAEGEIIYQGHDLLKLSEKQMRGMRGNEIAMIFQEPMSSLNPVYSVGSQIVEAIKLHQNIKGKAAWERAVEMLRRVGIADPSRRARAYPHQLSGGMRQRVMIAIALSCGPALLIADEPTAALDVTIQAQILDLLKQLQKLNNMSILLISHDLAVVAEYADTVAVMYLGRIVESAPARDLYVNPRHPYTMALLSAIPETDPDRRSRRIKLPGEVPSPLQPPGGCPFHPRCHIAVDRCKSEAPQLEQKGDDPEHIASCWVMK
ncbi:ABC transporter ATP-binding protein [Planctomycetota bacterium]